VTPAQSSTLVSKYVDHLPPYRARTDLRGCREGADADRRRAV